MARELETHEDAHAVSACTAQPEEQKIERLISALASLSIDARLPEEGHHARSAGHHQAAGGYRGPARSSNRSIVRAMPQAVYQPDEHRPLRAGAHAIRALHVADPALSGSRRASNAEGAHRRRTSGAAVRYEATQLAVMGESLSKLEKRADEADRYVATFLKCTYLRERIGQTFRGLITTVVEFGCFVQILDVGVDGLLHIDNLRDDDYEMADNGHAWIGRRTRSPACAPARTCEWWSRR